MAEKCLIEHYDSKVFFKLSSIGRDMERLRADGKAIFQR